MTEWFVPTEIGRFHIYCSQYCGAKHAEMVGTVIVQSQADYQAWLAGADPNEIAPRVAGEKLFTTYGCVSCHGQRAPSLAGLYGRTIDVIREDGTPTRVEVDEQYLRNKILYSSYLHVPGYNARLMPSFAGLSEEQLMDLVAYIKSLAGAVDDGKFHGADSGPTTQPDRSPPAVNNPPAATIDQSPGR